jgi:predicted amidohydrolase
MKMPKLEKPDRYVGLYVVDFGDGLTESHTGVGFTAEEVAELFESEKYKHCKAYKIHRAYADGRLELKGVRRELFQLEGGMFFYSGDIETARDDYKRLVKLGVETEVPCRAKVHLAKYSDDKFAVALVYPAEYDNEISDWLLERGYKTAGEAEGGTVAVSRYYDAKPEILERHQLWGRSAIESRTGEELLAATKIAVQR